MSLQTAPVLRDALLEQRTAEIPELLALWRAEHPRIPERVLLAHGRMLVLASLREIPITLVASLDLGRSQGGGRGAGRRILAGVALSPRARLPCLGPYRVELRLPAEMRELQTPAGVERVGAYWRIEIS